MTYLDVDDQGRVRPLDLKAAIQEDTILVSVMQVNNEIGTIQPIREMRADHERLSENSFSCGCRSGHCGKSLLFSTKSLSIYAAYPLTKFMG